VACTHNTTALIFDEVVTGFRVSPGGTQARFGIIPDLTTLAKILAGGMPGGAVCGKKEIVSMIEFRDGDWNTHNRVQHPGTFNANPVSAAAGSAMLELVRSGEHQGMNDAIADAGLSGAVYGLASYFHVTLGRDVQRPADGVEWQAATPPPGMAGPVQAALKRAMLNLGVDLMGGAGGFVSGVHTTDDIEQTITGFGSAIRALQGDKVL
jgi:glutamate-1-semialdehyde 2,1-aminomutase